MPSQMCLWASFHIAKACPLTFRITLAPLFGKVIWGWFRDLVDSLAMVTFVAGICTSMGLDTKQIVGGNFPLLTAFSWMLRHRLSMAACCCCCCCCFVVVVAAVVVVAVVVVVL
ncbi:unnamed protein product [Polarella glacialis]|uniref:Uncharacterized protein n=1 Tax=Polarella glacialis TaxID=89957 RepID=A0A813IIC7_POLGL|nr:unnamed protein product [Polarella glacialis]CAE8651166.1 unnamed protein product [Polarella glacialis]CAE8684047.1 unnamed protein product [Polarella glacialis]